MNRNRSTFVLLITLALVGAALAQGLFLYLSGRWPPVRFGLAYQFTAESVFDRIDIEGPELSYTYFEDTEHKCERWLEQRPCWQSDDLETIRLTLSREQVDELIRLVESGGFMLIPRQIGGAKPGQRFYPYALSIAYGAHQNAVTYQSFPEAEPMPEAFEAIRDKLFEFLGRSPR